MTPNRSIPKIIHQIWVDSEIPERFRSFRDSWLRHHADWTHRLWTDDELDSYIRSIDPEVYDVYKGHSRPICRADIARYVILKNEGGLYVDLDFECFKPLDQLFADGALVFGIEPATHVASAKAQERGLKRILCPSLIASPPNHVFWDAVFAALKLNRDKTDVLDATGPFLLTNVFQSLVSSRQTGFMKLLPPDWIYPVDKTDCWQGRLHDPVYWEKVTRNAYALHHWDGGWFRDVLGKQNISFNYTVRQPRDAKTQNGPSHLFGGPPPLISCLMTTRDRPLQAQLAIDMFRYQTYTNRELIIVDDSSNDLLRHYVSKDRNIRYIRPDDQAPNLGRSRNLSVSLANGPFVCQWDDDDIYDPQRLELQMAALLQSGAKACLLPNWTVWWPERKQLCISKERSWEGSLLCERECLPSYPELAIGEDTPAVQKLIRSVRTVYLDMPWLYIYVVHGKNTYQPEHFNGYWHTAKVRFGADRYEFIVDHFSKRTPLKAYIERLNSYKYPSESAADISIDSQPKMIGELPSSNTDKFYRKRQSLASFSKNTEFYPEVLVLTPVRNAAHSLEDYVRSIEKLGYPADRLRIAFLEGDSTDKTVEVLDACARRLEQGGRRVEVFRQDFGVEISVPRWLPSIQRARRGGIAQARNWLLFSALKEEPWVLWIDADVVAYPPDVLTRLLAVRRDIVVPHCVVKPGGRTFDMNTFIAVQGEGGAKPGADGLIQPPAGEGRRYLDAYRGQDLVEVDSVGGTMLLVRADIHRAGLIFPPVPVNGLIETEAFAAMAREAGYRCWGLPDLEIQHAPT